MPRLAMTLIRRTAVVTAVALAISSSQLQSTAANADTGADSPTTTVSVPEVGPSDDAREISSAASDYVATDPSSAAALAAAASAETASEMTVTRSGLETTLANGTEISVTKDGGIVMDSPSTAAIEFGVAGEATTSVVVDGALVQSEVAPSTDVVIRGVENGVQMVAILNDEAAPATLEFPADLASGMKFVPQDDGSIAVVKDVVIDVPLHGEDERVASATDAILGDNPESDVITDEQWAALEAIPSAETRAMATTEQVATIAPAWAVDANGDALDTHYVVDGETIKQVIDLTEDTAFPVTADPAWWWWVATGVTCAAQLGSFLFAVAKLAGVVAKVTKIIKASATLTKLVNKLGGVKAVFTKMYQAAKGWIEGKATKYISAAKLADLKLVLSKGKDLVFDLLGVGACVALLTTK